MDQPGFPLFATGTDPVIYDNGVVAPNTGLSSQLDTAYPFDSQVADDFSLPVGGGGNYDVTGITFGGLYFATPPSGPATTDFNVIFYDNAAGVPTGGPTDPTGTAIAFQTVNGTGTPTGTEQFDWTLEFPVPVVLAPSTQYWVAVQWIGNFPPQFGWRGDNTGGGNAVQGFPLLGTDYWTLVSPNAEMAFLLHGVQQPIPVEVLQFSVD